MRAGRVLVSAGLALGVLAGCGGSGSERQAAATAAPTSEAPAFLEPGLRFSDEAELVYIEALGKVGKQLAADRDAIAHGREICLDITQGKTDAQVTKNAAARFEVDSSTAEKIVKATKSSLCGE